MLQAPRASGGTVRQGFALLAREHQSNISRLRGRGVVKKRAFGRKGVLGVAGEVDTSSGVAGRYATALFELALEEQALEQVAVDLTRFNEALDAFEDLTRLVKSPVFSAEEQGKALAAILEKLKIEGLTRNFLLLVTAAAKLTQGQITALKQALKAALGKDVMLDERVDPSLLGGLVVKVGSRMIDTSLRTRLNSLKVAMKEVG